MEAQNNEVQHRPSSLHLTAACPGSPTSVSCIGARHSPSLHANGGQRGRPLQLHGQGVWRLGTAAASSARADKQRGCAGDGLITLEESSRFLLPPCSPQVPPPSPGGTSRTETVLRARRCAVCLIRISNCVFPRNHHTGKAGVSNRAVFPRPVVI